MLTYLTGSEMGQFCFRLHVTWRLVAAVTVVALGWLAVRWLCCDGDAGHIGATRTSAALVVVVSSSACDFF